MSGSALVPTGAPSPRRTPSRLLPAPLRSLVQEIDERISRLPTHLNDYGYDRFGFDPEYARSMLVTVTLMYRYWLRVESTGIERVPPGRVLLIGNHAGNNLAWDGAMLGMALFLEGEPPRMVRGMAEYYLPTIPFFGT